MISMQDISDAARQSLAGHQVKVFVSGSTPDKEGHQMTRVLDLGKGGARLSPEDGDLRSVTILSCSLVVNGYFLATKTVDWQAVKAEDLKKNN